MLRCAIINIRCLHSTVCMFFFVSPQHESIVREIEEALRKEIIAASTLPERPRYDPLIMS